MPYDTARNHTADEYDNTIVLPQCPRMRGVTPARSATASVRLPYVAFFSFLAVCWPISRVDPRIAHRRITLNTSLLLLQEGLLLRLG